MTESKMNPEQQRLEEDKKREKNWKRWGPYLSERQWGTVREDYSKNGDVWNSFTHDMARSRSYRWGEDGLLGFTDRQCRLCFALALWNGKDPILKERLFGLAGNQGNHGEDCKELYYYLDSSPTHSFCKALYKYPQREFPYQQLTEENGRRGFHDPEYELLDTGIFDGNQYFDVEANYAKETPNDILIRINITNKSEQSAVLDVLPTLWFRNTWVWGCKHEGCTMKPRIKSIDSNTVITDHETLDPFLMSFAGDPNIIFTENETNFEKLWGGENFSNYTKDAFHRYIIDGDQAAVHPKKLGTKVAAHYHLSFEGGETKTIECRLYPETNHPKEIFGKSFAKTFQKRIDETDEYYQSIEALPTKSEAGKIQRQAFAGLLWTKQFFHYSVLDWLTGDPGFNDPPQQRWEGRNNDWRFHLFNRDIISMPDKWEFPWYATWDTAFHMIPFARLDPHFAQEQLILFLREWYMHPNGQLPAYEFDFGDVNPPVHAWACWRVYKMTAAKGCPRDRNFLARVFQKLLINFTWWINRKDPEGNNLFAGGFLGLDNIGVFDRSKPLPEGYQLQQADSTAWMAFYCLTMLSMAMELALEDPAYEDVASKFFEHFIAIADAMNSFGDRDLWDSEENFYYDLLIAHGEPMPLKIRSLVGLIPICAVAVIEESTLEKLKGFNSRKQWFLDHRKDLMEYLSYMSEPHKQTGRRLLAIPSEQRLRQLLHYMLDEDEFLSPYGIRSLSKYHEEHPFVFNMGNEENSIRYNPGESDNGLFGGNSNWRGPIWFPLNFLLIESLEKYHYFFGDEFQVECPTGSGNMMNLQQVADELSKRLCKIFLPDENGKRASHGRDNIYQNDPDFKDLVLFYEYFNGDTGEGHGANHQTGWTALVAKLLQDEG